MKDEKEAADKAEGLSKLDEQKKVIDDLKNQIGQLKSQTAKPQVAAAAAAPVQQIESAPVNFGNAIASVRPNLDSPVESMARSNSFSSGASVASINSGDTSSAIASKSTSSVSASGAVGGEISKAGVKSPIVLTLSKSDGESMTVDPKNIVNNPKDEEIFGLIEKTQEPLFIRENGVLKEVKIVEYDTKGKPVKFEKVAVAKVAQKKVSEAKVYKSSADIRRGDETRAKSPATRYFDLRSTFDKYSK